MRLPHRLPAAALALLAATFAVSLAYAQDVDVDPAVSIEPFVSFVLPILHTIIATVIAVGLPIVIAQASRKFGLQIEKDKRDALQVTLTNAAGGLLQKLGEDAKALKVDVSNPHVRDAVKRVVNGAPDALRWAGLNEAEIARRVLEKLPQIAPPTPVSDPIRNRSLER